MTLESALRAIRAHKAELSAAGVSSAAVFGSLPRGDNAAGSDIDLAIRLADDSVPKGFEYFGLIEDLGARFSEILGAPVDIVVEPVRRESLRQAIERDRIVAF
jgi:predicted nucleotidyltransferase